MNDFKYKIDIKNRPKRIKRYKTGILIKFGNSICRAISAKVSSRVKATNRLAIGPSSSFGNFL